MKRRMFETGMVGPDGAASDEQGELPRGIAHLHLIVGPVGAGKSTFALRLSREHRAVRLNLDEWMTELFGPDRPDTDVSDWYGERTSRCIEQIWRLTERMMAVNTSVVLEIGLLQRRERERFYRRVDASGYGLTVYVVDAPRELRRERVKQRSYPVIEKSGVLFAWLGDEGSTPPPFPAFDCFAAPATHTRSSARHPRITSASGPIARGSLRSRQ